MAETRYCRRCGSVFNAKRDDHYFCSARCVAAYYREYPNPEYIHAEKDHVHTHYCEQCGVPYNINDYAQRGGQRTPKYCSPKCKQAAYRARGKANQEQAERRYKGSNTDQKQGKQENTRGKQENANSGRSSGNANGHTSESEFWKGYRSKWAAATAILGVRDDVTAKELKAAFLALVRQYHPDTNKSPEATVMLQKINWAYGFLKKN